MRKQNGFTLLEAMIVLAIIGILASIVYGSDSKGSRNDEANLLAQGCKLKSTENSYTGRGSNGNTIYFPAKATYTCPDEVSYTINR